MQGQFIAEDHRSRSAPEEEVGLDNTRIYISG
jgi:hypothetical protein